MDPKVAKTCGNVITPHEFCNAVNILVEKPHVVNKRLWGSKLIFRHSCKPLLPVIPLKECKRITNNAMPNVLEHFLQNLSLLTCEDRDATIELIMTELLPKIFSESHAFQIFILNKEQCEVKIFDVTPEDLDQKLCPAFPFSLKLSDNNISFATAYDESNKSVKWLEKTVLPQFVKWCEEDLCDRDKQFCTKSLFLVSGDKYYSKYNELKNKHGKEMVKIWPECTDPAKFVYEDIAIATYLLLLWEEERKNSEPLQSFVDLGCGNGLLVYILSMEGHKGTGIDVRKRHIWDLYPKNVVLEEKTVTPSDINLFPETDWIIGNHSDELTPWIPVIAARSSYRCKFFLLPCCAYNFDGTKYQRANSSKSQYNDYLDYVIKLCMECGFHTEVDRLKIPSTKRICMIGRTRIYEVQEHEKYSNQIQKLINVQPSYGSNDSKCWIEEFKAREPVEKARNCTQIEKSLIESIVNAISKYLLEHLSDKMKWNPGKTAPFNELIQLIPKEDLKALKSECGGLQTLLKNNHHIFKVQNGKVQLRHPKSIKEINEEMKTKKTKSKNIKIQQKPCWFYNNHPQGCPLSNSDCSFVHVTNK